MKIKIGKHIVVNIDELEHDNTIYFKIEDINWQEQCGAFLNIEQTTELIKFLQEQVESYNLKYEKL